MVGIFALLGGMAMGIVTGTFGNPIGTWLSQEAFKLMPVLIPDPGTTIQMRWRGLITDDEYKDFMKKKGFNEGFAEKIFETSKRVLDSGLLVSAKWRGIITEEEFYQRMAALQYTKEEADKFEQTMKYFPSPSDLIRFAVREVYTPEIVQKYGMMEDLPPEFLKEAAKAGLDEQQAKNYWAAHWVLPSLSDGFEMFHRGIITEDELKTLMRTLDVMPGWRDKLIKIAYSPFSRVDVRRMYSSGVLTRDDVKRAYMDLGYDEEKAEKLTEFTVRYEAQEDIKAAADPILSSLKAKEITPEEALDQLQQIGLTPEKAALKVNKIVAEMQNEEREKWANVLSDLYVKGVMDEDKFLDGLGKLNLSADAMEKIRTMADLERLKNTHFPSLSDIKRWYAKNIIDEHQATELMKRLNLSDETIKLYFADWATPADEEEPKLPDKSDIRLWLRKGIIDEDTARILLSMLRYPDQVVEWYIEDWRGK